MKIALAVWNGRISPVFDVSRQVLVLEIQKGMITGKQDELFINDDPLYRVCRLADLNIEILICGAISQMLAGMLTAYKIRTIPFIAGEVEEVVAAYLTNRLPNPLLSMPGCCRQREQNYKGVRGLLEKRGGRQRMANPGKFGKIDSSKTRKENNMPGGNRKGPCGSGTQRSSQDRGCGKQGGRGQGGQGRGQGCGQGQGQRGTGPYQKQDTKESSDNKNSSKF